MRGSGGEFPRIIAVNRALPEFGTPFAFPLNLDPDLIRAANDNVRGFPDHVRRKVVRTLKRALIADATGLGITMHLMTMTVGDLHADLWPGLTIHHRRVEGPEDVTVEDHADLGLCVVSHWGGEDRIERFSQRPIDTHLRPAVAPV